MGMTHLGAELRRKLVAKTEISPFIGIYDSFSATIASKYSQNLFYSGFGFAASHYGLPDLGFIAWSDILQAAWRIRQILPHHSLLVDIDDGYVDPDVACHVVMQLEAMGVAMVMLEDQARPRRCGHFDGKVLLPLSNYLDKLQRVLSARRDMCVLARTDAHGSEIFRRVEALSATTADVLLVDGVDSIDVLKKIRAITAKPILFNQVAGGKSPRLSLSELRSAGVALSLYSTPCLFAAQSAIDSALSNLFKDDGRLPDVRTGVDVGVKDCTNILRQNLCRLPQDRSDLSHL